MSNEQEPDTTFDDFEEEVDDAEAIDAYAADLTAAVSELGLEPNETGTSQSDLPEGFGDFDGEPT